jgi:DNA-binding MarR family transcriptional regulator
MSSVTRRRAARIAALLNAGRDFSTAAVMFHHAVADRHGLSVTDLKTLDVLQRRGRLTAGEIAAQTSLATASVTSLIDRLEAKRLVRRVRDANDRRRVMVALTPHLETSIAPLFASLSRRMLARFKKYSGGQIALIETFLTDGANEMREEAAKLPVLRSSTIKSVRAARVHRKQGP